MDDLVSLLRPLGPACLDVVVHDFGAPGTWESLNDAPPVYIPSGVRYDEGLAQWVTVGIDGQCNLVFAMSLKGCDPQWPVYFTADDLTNMARAAPLFTITITNEPDLTWVSMGAPNYPMPHRLEISDGLKDKVDLIRPVRVTRDRPLGFTVVARAAGHFEAVLHYIPMSIDRANRLVEAGEKGIAEFIRGGS